MDIRTKMMIDKLKSDLEFYSKRYYEGDPVIPDSEYDALHDQLLTLQRKYPEIEDKVGYSPEQANAIHKHQMLSLKSTKELMSAEAFFSKNRGEISCEPKIDGVSIELVYRDLELAGAATRGDGVVGEYVTENISFVERIPQRIFHRGDIEIYGEIYITKADFIRINQKRVHLGHSIYSSPRNAAAGIVRSADCRDYAEYLSFFPYTLKGADHVTQCQCFVWLDINGFDILPELVEVIGNDISFHDYYNRMLKLRSSLPMDIDGLVFKVNDLRSQEEIGYALTHPLWAIALKFNPTRVYTRLNNVVFQVGKSGIVAPVAILDEVKINNSKVNRASLANRAIIESKDIRINDMVAVEMANDVIPYVAEVDPNEKRTGQEIPIVFPSACPSCQYPLSPIGPHMVCANPKCKAQLVGRVDAAVGRKGFYIKELGKKMIEELVNSRFVSAIYDIFKLDSDEYIVAIKEKLGWGDKTLKKLRFEIDDSRLISLDKFIFALGIPDVSTATAIKLAEEYGTLDNMIESIKQDGVARLNNTSSETLSIIENYFQNPINIDMINRFLDHGVIVTKIIFKKASKTIVVTGGFSNMSRSEIGEIARRYGYKLGSTVTKATEFVVVGTNPSETKVSTAKRLGIRIVTGTDLNTIFQS